MIAKEWRIPLLVGACVLLAGALYYFRTELSSTSEIDARGKMSLVDLAEEVPGLLVDLKYYSGDNFTGRKVPGYGANRALGTPQLAEALKGVQEELSTTGLSLIIYDAYRPRRAVDHFVRWAANAGDTVQKSRFYPKLSKAELFEKGYIASPSSHSRGSTVDVGLWNVQQNEALDMGTEFDYFGPESGRGNQALSEHQRANRSLLREAMIMHGFEAYAREWWHFTLRDEPFPDRYLDVKIR